MSAVPPIIPLHIHRTIQPLLSSTYHPSTYSQNYPASTKFHLSSLYIFTELSSLYQVPPIIPLHIHRTIQPLPSSTYHPSTYSQNYPASTKFHLLSLYIFTELSSLYRVLPIIPLHIHRTIQPLPSSTYHPSTYSQNYPASTEFYLSSLYIFTELSRLY